MSEGCLRCPVSVPPGEGSGRHAPLLKALGDPTRLAILDLLVRAEGSLCACEIEACFDLSQPTISHHLRILRKAGVVGAHRRGTWMHYTLVPGGLAALAELAARLDPVAERSMR